jgi:hypothetical protein
MRRNVCAVFVVLVLGGSSGCFRQVRSTDLDAWHGVSVFELQTHPLFSTLPKQAEELGDGRELWTYSNCGRATAVCSSFGTTAVCSAKQNCCHNQFFVSGDTVESYRPVGRCYTDCSVRPASRPCQGG